MSALAQGNEKQLVGERSVRAELAQRDIDPFALSETLETQNKVFLGLFGKDSDGANYETAGGSEDSLRKFWDAVRAGYLEALEPGACKGYHTYTHALDVMLTSHSMLSAGGSVVLPKHEQTGMLLAAYAHDVLHPGMNNMFYVNTKAPVALKYDNKSVLELQSIDFAMPMVEKLNIFEENSEAYNLIVDCIKWTDMSLHKDLVGKIEAFHGKFLATLNEVRTEKGMEAKECGICQEDVDKGIDLGGRFTSEERSLFASFMMHCADISNCAKGWSVTERWAVCIMNEFWSQGDTEKALGLPVSFNCDRESVETPKCQWGFITFMLIDLFKLFERFLPELGKWYSDNLVKNQSIWKEFMDKGEPYSNVFRPPSKVGGWKAPISRE